MAGVSKDEVNELVGLMVRDGAKRLLAMRDRHLILV